MFSLPRGRRYRLADHRTVLIPNQWNGSVQQYYHFLLGYLAPVLQWTTRHPDTPIAVRDCGPMNRWFDLMKPQTDLEIMHVGDVLHVLAGNLQPNKVLKGMDFPDQFSRSQIQEFASHTLAIAQQRHPAQQGTHKVIVSDRASHDNFFASSAAEWPESGSQKRSVPNLMDLVNSWGRSDVVLIDGATTDMYEQVVRHSQATTLIGQHGAGLTNMIWMSPGSHVIESLPPMPDDAKGIFRTLARTLDLHYTVVPQHSVHAPIDTSALTAAFQQSERPRK